MTASQSLIMKPCDWPKSDGEAWRELLRKDSPFDNGLGANWSDGSVKKRQQAYGRWLGFLRQNCPEAFQEVPHLRFTPARVAMLIETETDRIKLVSAKSTLGDLLVIAQFMAPEGDWAWFRSAYFRFSKRAGKQDLKPRPPVDSGQVMRAARAEMEKIDAPLQRPTVQDAWKFRDGLALALLIARPVRARAFFQINIGKQ